MAIDSSALNTTDWEISISNSKPDEETFQAIVIWDGRSYSALCRELDIASCGDSAAEAFFALRSAVVEAVSVAREAGVAAGEPVSDKVMVAFLAQHKGPQPISGYTFTI